MIRDFYQQTILPRLCFFPYFATNIILSIIEGFYWFFRSRRRHAVETHLCIEAGVNGWKSIEFKELYQSSCEYLSPQNVHRLVVLPDQNYLRQIANLLQSEPITHYLYDPRTHNSNVFFWSALWQSLRVAILLAKHEIVPIILLTDLSVRAWRAQAAVVSARKGLVVCFMAPKCVGTIFPHRRLLGPCLMPFSVQTKEMLNNIIMHRRKNISPVAIFTGSLYEPRATKLEQIRTGLASQGVIFDIKGRQMGSERSSDEEYWSRLCYADIVVTTADQAIQSGTDWSHIPHLIYRYLEVLASGALLVAQDVPSVRRFFTPGIHFVSFDSSNDAIKVINHYMEHELERRLIAEEGHKRANALIDMRIFWVSVDSMLGSDSLH